MPSVRSRLPGLRPSVDHMRVDQPEGVDDDLPLHALNRVHHHGYRPVVQLFKAGLGVDINHGQPSVKARVGVVPPNYDLMPACLLEQFQHVGLVLRVDGFDGYPSP